LHLSAQHNTEQYLKNPCSEWDWNPQPDVREAYPRQTLRIQSRDKRVTYETIMNGKYRA